MDNINHSVEIPVKTMTKLVIELWRHNKTNKNTDNMRTRRLKNQIEKIIELANIKIYDLEGEKYDPGLALEVIHFITDNNKSETIIDEMISPIVILNSKVINYGQVVLSGPKYKEG